MDVEIKFDSARLQKAGGLEAFMEWGDDDSLFLVLPLDHDCFTAWMNGREVDLAVMFGGDEEQIAARLEDIGSPAVDGGEVSGSTYNTDGGEG